MSRTFKTMKGNKGYTIAETVVYVGLLALLLLALFQITFSIASSHKRSRAYLDVNSAAVTAFGRFSRDIRVSTSVDTTNSTLSASQGKLALLMKKSDGSYDATTFYLSNGKVKVDQNSVYLGDLTSDNMEVSNLTFRLSKIASTSAVRVEMTLAPDASSTVPAINFYGTYVLRGSYLQ